jgi:hypothetical protein
MTSTVSKLNPEWITATRHYFLDFLELTNFPHPVRDGIRGTEFNYPEWLIMFIAVLAVKCKEKSYLGIHRMTKKYWSTIAAGENLPVISESQLREIKKNLPFAWKTSRFYISSLSFRVLRFVRRVPIK